jgi:uncharacterized protein
VLELRTNDETAHFRLEVAQSWFARLKGLIGRRELRAGEGLFLPGTNGVHMFFMRFPIDCVFVGGQQPDGSRIVVAVSERLAPWTGIVLWVRGAHGAIELAAGAARQAGIRPGDTVFLAPADATG